MRVLKPEAAQDRKEKILNWVVYNYVSTGRPVSSELIALEGKFNVSSATIRNILKELEAEGYLYQPHTSGGRIPTDAGYRAYVDNVIKLQRLAAAERNRVEEEYERRIEQLDGFLRNTSRMLADMSRCAGFVVSSDMQSDSIKRLDLISAGSRNIISMLFAHSGLIKHAAFTLENPIDKAQLRLLSARLNRRLRDVPVSDAAAIIWKEFQLPETDTAKTELLRRLAEYLDSLSRTDDMLFFEGLNRIFENIEPENLEEVRSMARLLDEKERFAAMMRERLRSCSVRRDVLPEPGRRSHQIEVTIGSENQIREFRNFSLISSAYCLNERTVGMVGILGYKRMEYPKMISIVDSVSSMVEEILGEWEGLEFDD